MIRGSISLLSCAAVVLSCAPKVVPEDRKGIPRYSFHAPPSDHPIPAPPSDAWKRVPSDQHDEISYAGMKQFQWNWEVYSEGDRVMVRHADFFRPYEDLPLPFETKKEGMCGEPKALRIVYKGPASTWTEWILGFDCGEWGGSVWRTGKIFYPDGWRWYFEQLLGEHAIALYKTPKGVVVLSGLAHINRNYGKVFLLSTDILGTPGIINVELLDAQPIRHLMQSDGSIMFTTGISLWGIEENGTKLRKICDEDKVYGTPRAYAVDEKGSVLFFTNRGLWRVESYTEVTKLCEVDTDASYPNQIYTPLFIGKNGEVYVGLTYYLIRLIPGEKECEQEWYVPADCSKTALKNGRCTCTEGKLAGKPCSSL
jgi:hypothetical protein